MRAVITVLGKDMVGILAKVSAKCAEVDVNVIESNTIYFTGFVCNDYDGRYFKIKSSV